MAAAAPPADLTVILPVRNRPDNLAGQLRVFDPANCPYPILVADSSDPEPAAAVQQAATGRAEYHAWPASMSLYQKLAETLGAVTTPFVLLTADRKITLPHAVTRLLAHMRAHPEAAAALGYVLGFQRHADEIDIHRVVYFTPTIGEAEPLRRLYHLMRRYQSWIFGVYRRDVALEAARQAACVAGPMFQELMFMNVAVLQGSLARLPVVMTLQSPEHSWNASTRTNPFRWFLDDSSSFFSHFAAYRASLTAFVEERGLLSPGMESATQLIDTVHGLWLHREIDDGTLSYAARRQLGEDLPAPSDPPGAARWTRRRLGDAIHRGDRHRAIWRRGVLYAKPRTEIRIDRAEFPLVGAALDRYVDVERSAV